MVGPLSGMASEPMAPSAEVQIRRKGWQAVADAISLRRRELGLAQKDLAARSGVSPATLRKLCSGAEGHYRPQTLARVSEALDWPPNALVEILGGAAMPASPAPAPQFGRRTARLATRAERLAPHELRAVERLVEELLSGPQARRTRGRRPAG